MPKGHYLRPTLEQRLLSNRAIQELTNCWNWTKALTEEGYGKMTFNCRTVVVHRMAAVLWLGLDYDSSELALHHCDNRACFNPEHLYIGTHADNIHDAINRHRHWTHTGEQCSWAKISAKTVRQIRSEYRRGQKGYGYVSLGRKYNLHAQTVKAIIIRRIWKGV